MEAGAPLFNSFPVPPEGDDDRLVAGRAQEFDEIGAGEAPEATGQKADPTPASKPEEAKP